MATDSAEGSPNPHDPIASGSQTMNLAVPMTLPAGTVPEFGSPVHRMPFSASVGVLVQWAPDRSGAIPGRRHLSSRLPKPAQSRRERMG